MQTSTFHNAQSAELSIHIFILKRLRNRFLQLILISLSLSLSILLPGNYTSTRAECVGPKVHTIRSLESYPGPYDFEARIYSKTTDTVGA